MEVWSRLSRISPQGFSLVELLIALLLGSVLTAGVLQLFIANSATYRLLAGQSRLQESARFALDFISNKVRQAGNLGCFADGDRLYTTLDPQALPYEFDLRLAIQGYEATGDGIWHPTLTRLPHAGSMVFATTYGYGARAGINLDGIASGTDVVTFWHASQVEAHVVGYIGANHEVITGPIPTSAEQVVVVVPQGWDEFDKDHLAIVYDCRQATLFRVTTANPWGRRSSGRPSPAPNHRQLTIGHDLDDNDATRNQIMALGQQDTFGSEAAVAAIRSHTFFIAPGAGVNNVGDRPLSLWRKSGLERPIELVAGIEDLQFLYGIDTDGDRIPNQYLKAHLIEDWRQVFMVQITLIANSIDQVGATSFADGLLRRSFTQTILLRNRS